MTLVTVSELSVLSPQGAAIVDDVSFTIDPGEILGVVGESGSGKSTIGLALLGYARRGARITAGRIEIDGTAVLSLDDTALRQARGTLVAHIPQDPAAALNPALSIGRQLRETLTDHHLDDGGHHAACAELMRAVGLPDEPTFLKRYPHQLSGGQQQRICIAMAFACHPRVIVLDEPTTGLDVTTQARILALVTDLCRRNEVAALYISHDLAAVSSLADRVMVLYAGRVAELGPQADVLRQPAHPYTRALLGSTPDIHRRLELTAIPGRAPAPHERHGGCSFEPRCAHRIDVCATTTPLTQPVTPQHAAACHRALEVAQLGTVLSFASQATRPKRADAPLLTIDRLNAFYGSVQVLHDVDLEVEPGWCVALVGESGSGKTTLARCLAGLHALRTGTIRLAGEVLPEAARDRDPIVRQRLQYVFQNPYGALNPRRTIGDSVRLPARHFHQAGARELDKHVDAALERVGLPRAIARAYPDRLSGGERQRAAIARALVCEPQILICDEITSALDVSVQAAIIELLGSLKDGGLTTIFVTHDLAVVRSIADHIAVLSGGRVVEAGAVDQLLDTPGHQYTRELVASSPRLAP